MGSEYVNPNQLLFDRITSSGKTTLMNLFAPDHTKQMQAMTLGSQVAENQANATKLRSDAALNGQEFDAGEALTPDLYQAAMAGDPRARATLAANAARRKNPDNIANAFTEILGAAGLQDATTEAESRKFGAIQNGGTSAPLNNPYTQGGIDSLFAQETAIQGSKNQTELAKAQMDADAKVRAAHIAAGPEGKMYNVDGALVDASGVVHYQAPTPITSDDSKKVADQILAGLPAGAPVDGFELQQAAGFATQEAQKTHDMGSAIAHAIALFDRQNGEKPWFAPNTDPSASFNYGRYANVTGRTPVVIDPTNRASMNNAPPALAPIGPGQRAGQQFKWSNDAVPPEVQAQIEQGLRNGNPDFNLHVPPAAAAPADNQFSDVRGSADTVARAKPAAKASSKPPVPGARQAPDGKWYVKQNGKYFRVDG